MENVRFYKSFSFRVLFHREDHHTDNSAGIDSHFLARMHSGHARIVTLDGEELSLTAGDVFYLPLGLRYHSYWYAENGTPVQWESYRFSIFPSSKKISYKPALLHPSEKAMGLIEELSSHTETSPTSVGLLYQILGELLPSMDESVQDPREALYRRATDYIEAHPTLRVSELAKHCNISESGLYAFFRQYAGASPIEIKNRIVTERAVILLESTDLSAEEICEQLGFSSIAYFRKLIRIQTGKTPGQIRRESYLI